MALPQLTTPLGRIDLTQLDYAGIVAQIKSIITTNPKYQSKFSSLFEGDAGVMLIELFAQIAHMNNLRIDFTANELSWLNAEQEQTILNFLPLIDYRLKSVLASQTTVLATVINQPGAVSTTQILVPAKTRLKPLNTEGRQSACEILASKTNYTSDIILAPGIRTYTLNVFAGLTEFVDVQVTQASNFTFKLNRSNVIDDSLQIFKVGTNNNFTLLTRVDSFISPLGTLPSYTARFDFTGTPTIIFGNKFFGGSFDGVVTDDPSTWVTLRFYYRYLPDSNGTVTDYTPGAINETLDFFIPAEGRKITLQFFNQDAGFGGSDILSLDEVKQQAPLTIRTAEKAVTNEDFEIFLSSNTVVKDVLVITPNEEPNLTIPIFHAHAFVAPNRTNSNFIPVTDPPLDGQMPDPLPSETQDEYNVRFLNSITSFYNITGIETSAKITSTLSDATFPIVLQVNDTMRLVVDTDDVVSGFVEVKLKENVAKTREDIVTDINSGFPFPLARIENGSIVLESPVKGTGSFVQLVGNNSDVFQDGIISLTYQTLGFAKDQFSQGQDQSLEAANLAETVVDKQILGIELKFKPIIVSPFKIHAQVFYNKNSNRSIVESAIRTALNDNFSYQSTFMSKSIVVYKIAKIIQDIDGVEDATILEPTGRIDAAVNQVYFIIDQFILDNLPTRFPDMASLYDIQLDMVRSV